MPSVQKPEKDLPKETKHDPATNSVIFAGNALEFHLGMRDKYNTKALKTKKTF